MKIVFNGSPTELNSPFYIKNKEICLKWKKFAESKGGEIGGRCNAWSFQIQGNIHENCEILVKKATFSSGFLWLPKDQGLFVQTEFLLKIDLSLSNFTVRKSRMFDFIRRLIFKHHHRIDAFKKYHFIGDQNIQNQEDYRLILKILAYGMRQKELNLIKYNAITNRLKVSSRSTQLHLSEVEKLLSLLPERN